MRFIHLAFVLLALSLAGCGGTTAASGSTTVEPEPSSEPDPSSDPEPANEPSAPAPSNCESYHYSTCPEGCVSECIGSCDACDDCDGPGSCHAP